MAEISKNKLSQQKTLSLSRAKNVPTFIDIPGIQQESRRPLIQEKALGQIWRLPQKKKKRNAGKSLFSHFILKISPQYTGEPFKALGNFSLCRSKKLMEKCRLHFYNFVHFVSISSNFLCQIDVTRQFDEIFCSDSYCEIIIDFSYLNFH